MPSQHEKCKKNTRFQAFYLANDEKTCRQFQGGEPADSLVYANVTASNPSQFPNFPCCLRCMPQLLGSCHVFSVSGGGVWVGGVAGGGWGGGWGGGVGWGWVGVGWENNVIGACRARPHIRDATLVYACVRSLALLSYPHVRHATPTWCYVETCLLHLPTDLMLRCNMSLALAAGCWDMMKSFMFRYNAGCKMWNLVGKLAKNCD